MKEGGGRGGVSSFKKKEKNAHIFTRYSRFCAPGVDAQLASASNPSRRRTHLKQFHSFRSDSRLQAATRRRRRRRRKKDTQLSPPPACCSSKIQSEKRSPDVLKAAPAVSPGRGEREMRALSARRTLPMSHCGASAKQRWI